jgi:protein AroM
MSDTVRDSVVGIYTIGQTPRPDLTEDLARYLGSSRSEIRGALDGLDEGQVPVCGADGYPLETRLRDGTRVVVDAAFVEPLLQQAIDEWDGRVSTHLVLCAGPFPRLTARRTLIQPFNVAVTELTEHGLRSLEVVVPFAAQAAPAVRKWEAAGFSCRAHELDKKPEAMPVARWLADRLTETSADALVFDYVGSRAAFLEEVGAEIGVPVLDLGHLALDALFRTMVNP